MSDPGELQIHNIRKQLGEFCLSIPELILAPGSILALLGPTGSGKSTLLRLLSSLETVTEGTITWNGMTYGRHPLPTHILRTLAYVPQRPLLISGTVLDNVALGLKFRGIKTAQDRAAELLSKLGLAKLGTRSARNLSGGQTQLIALARALVLEPDLLLLDEPTANLDPASVAMAEVAIAALHSRTGCMIVWVTHNLPQARRRCDQAALLLQGSLVEAAEISTFFSHPRDERTRRFVDGTMVY